MVARGRDARLFDGRSELAGAVLRKGLSRELRLEQPAYLGERDIDRHGDIDAALVRLRHEIKLLRERTIGPGFVRHDAGFRLHADQ